MAEQKKTYRFGVFCSGFSFPLWQAEVILHLMNDGHEPVVLVMDDTPATKKSSLQKVSRYTGRNGLYNLFERFRMKVPQKSLTDLTEVLRNAEVVSAVPEVKGFSQYFPDNIIKKVKECAPDFILRFGFNIIRGEILEAAQYGVWSYHHDDEMKYRGGPPAFWEIAQGDPVNGVILQRLTDRLDGGIILKKGYLKTTDHSYSGNLNRILESAVKWPAELCHQIAQGVFEMPSSPSTSNAPIYKRPGNVAMLKFLFKKTLNRVRFHNQELFASEKWNILLLKKNNSDDINLDGEVITLPNPARNHFYADPFLIKDKTKLYILFEDYSYKTEKGVIGYVEYDTSEGKVLKRTTALELEIHLAYPFLISHNGNIYCVPETSLSGTVNLYELNKASGKLEYSAQLLEFPGVDPTLFYYNGFWWLFCTHADASNEDLYIFYSDKIDGAYLPHKGNPVKTDISGARPGGRVFFRDGKPVRPAQMNSGKYGAGLVFHEIIRLTPEHYDEKTVDALKPFAAPGYREGIHTWCEDEEYLIVDGKEYGWNRYYCASHIKRKLSR